MSSNNNDNDDEDQKNAETMLRRRQQINDSLAELRDLFTNMMDKATADSEDFWNSLNSDQQLQVFCAVVSRIHQGELEEKKSYRGVLYEVFGFGPEAYVHAQHAGYMDIHNSIIDKKQLIKDFAEFCQIDSSMVDDFSSKFRL